MRDSVSEIKRTIQNSTNFLNDNLQKKEKKIIEKVQNQNRNTFTKLDGLVWAGIFLFGMFVCFMIVQNFTEEMVRKNLDHQITAYAEEPRKEAEAEAKKIIAEAKKEAQEIIKTAQKRAEENK